MTTRTRSDSRSTTRPATADRRITYPFDPSPKMIRALYRDRNLLGIDFAVLGVMMDFRLAFNDSCWCSKATIAAELRRSVRTVQYSLQRLEKAEVIRRVKVDQPDPDEPRNRTGWRIYFLFITGRTTFGPGPDRRSRADRKRPIDPCIDAHGGGQFFASPPNTGGEQSVAPPFEATDCFESQTEGKLDSETTTTAFDGARPAEESSSSFAPLVQDGDAKRPPTAEASPLVSAPEIPAADACPHAATGDSAAAAVPATELVDAALLTALAARVVALCRCSSRQAEAMIAVAISDYRAMAKSCGFRFQPDWVGNAIAEAERQESTGKIKTTAWQVVRGILRNYAREGGPRAQEPRVAGPKSFDPAICLARLESHGWTLQRDGPDGVKLVEIPGRGAPSWRCLPSDLREALTSRKAEMVAYVLKRADGKEVARE